MASLEEIRYSPTSAARRHDERATQEACDRLTGRRVILKTDAARLMRRELRLLLGLPRGVGPAVHNTVWTGEKLIVALERLEGRTLLEAGSELEPEALPALVAGLCRCLTRLHRAGFVHCDLKPSNIFLLDTLPEGRPQRSFQVRLLDFGFALSPAIESDADDLRGGTPGLIAPEVLHGWAVDHRADQYSLGVALQQQFPFLEKDRRWRPILDKLMRKAVAQRYADVTALAAEVRGVFDVDPWLSERPEFGCGPLRDREQEQAVAARLVTAHPGRPFVVQARPGIGLTRFLHSVVEAVAAREDDRPMRLVDLSAAELSAGGGLTAVRDFVSSRAQAGDTVVIGVADPSPGLHGLKRRAAWLRDAARGQRWERMTLTPLKPAALAEIVANSLGEGGAEAEWLGEALHRRTDGDLRLSARAFDEALARHGTAADLTWKLDLPAAQAAVRHWRIPPAPPALVDVPAALRRPLALCARAGRSFPVWLGEELLETFAVRSQLAELLDHGYLTTCAGRLHFVTRSLWDEAREARLADGKEADAWILRRHTPDAFDMVETYDACRRAHRAGRHELERAFLGAALEEALRERRYPDILQLLAYPEDEPPAWTLDTLRSAVARAAKRLGTEWTETRLLYAAGWAANSIGIAEAIALWEEAAAGSDERYAVAARTDLLQHALQRDQKEEIRRWRRSLEGVDRWRERVPDGFLEACEAIRAYLQRRHQEAEQLAERAAGLLRGRGDRLEVRMLQLLAILRIQRDPESAVEKLREARQLALDVDLRALTTRNLAMLLNRLHDFRGALQCAEDGLASLAGKTSLRRLVGIRIQRAWAWAHLDAMERAMAELRAVFNQLQARPVRTELIGARLLLCYCHLHQARPRAAVSVAAEAWREPTSRRQGAWADLLCNLADTVLEGEAWNTIQAYLGDIRADAPGQDDEAICAAARAAALAAQADRRPLDAVGHLEGCLEQARRLPAPMYRARFLHHLGVAQLAADKPEPAARFLSEALEALGTEGFAYYRASTMIYLSHALDRSGDTAQGLEVIEAAVNLARESRCMGALARALKTRAGLLTRLP
ncbi:MAG: protein kinase [Candidatus Eisenbacteria bacterium]|nr:protein kinase [Candidatus Eisenbacteria bacterium]